MKLEHIGIAVKDISASLAFFELVFGARPYKTEMVESEGVRTHFFDAGSTKLELLESTDPNSAVARFLEKRGEGIHHLAFSVDDTARDFRRLKSMGINVLDSGPKTGADGKQIFFVHPGDTHGILMEFCS